jgi:hypothetical protein
MIYFAVLQQFNLTTLNNFTSITVTVHHFLWPYYLFIVPLICDPVERIKDWAPTKAQFPGDASVSYSFDIRMIQQSI